MKPNTFQRVTALFLICCVMFVPCLVWPVSASVLEPYDYKTSIVPGDDGDYIVTVDLPKDEIFWAWGETPSDWITHHTETGVSSTFNTTENELDNWWLYILNFGYDETKQTSNMMATGNLTSDATLNIWFQLVMSCNTSQNFDLRTTVKVAYCDASGSVSSIVNVYVEEMTYEAGYNLQTFLIADNSFTLDSSLGEYFFMYITVDPSELADETITSPVSVGIYDNMNQIVMPLKSLYVQSQENAQLDKTMQKVEQQLAANGQKLDDILNAGDSEESGNIKDDIQGGAGDIEDKVDELEQVTKPSLDDLPNVEDIITDDVFNGFGPVLGVLFESDLIMSIFMVALVLALTAYVMFGKR